MPGAFPPRFPFLHYVHPTDRFPAHLDPRPALSRTFPPVLHLAPPRAGRPPPKPPLGAPGQPPPHPPGLPVTPSPARPRAPAPPSRWGSGRCSPSSSSGRAPTPSSSPPGPRRQAPVAIPPGGIPHPRRRRPLLPPNETSHLRTHPPPPLPSCLFPTTTRRVAFFSRASLALIAHTATGLHCWERVRAFLPWAQALGKRSQFQGFNARKKGSGQEKGPYRLGVTRKYSE